MIKEAFMKKQVLLLILINLLTLSRLHAKLLINELVTGSSSDWVELTLSGGGERKLDISSYYVTMYYGTNEPLSTEPVTIYSYDRAETPYDDRFVVVHLTEAGTVDETDRTGDTNHNGYIDIYCDNYYGSLWNSDGVVSLDSDDNPSNGGILDFVAYSNRDGGPNSTIESYILDASDSGEWSDCRDNGVQACSADIGESGLESYMSLSRKPGNDTNSAVDFAVTRYQTPGRENRLAVPGSDRSIFRTGKKRISIIPGHPEKKKGVVPLDINYSCNIRFRVFSVTGRLLYQSPLFRDVQPGSFSVIWDPVKNSRRTPTGLYIGEITAVSSRLRRSDRKTLFFVLSRYR
jgi:hypothetical protein